MTEPRSAADPRPGGKPYYIDQNCPTCGTPLVLADRLANPDAPDTEVWHDEWVCPKHVDEGVFMDWPSPIGADAAEVAEERYRTNPEYRAERDRLRPELREAFEAEFRGSEDALEYLRLSLAESEQFLDALREPPPPNEALRDAAAEYRERPDKD